ncbi:YbeF family transcriptional regulator [Cronobacter dublinensis]|uniref:DNA-binding transcriptional regulator n=2 Tax=Cronobacter dublinensis TaxID=413497 RepID=A0A9Q4T2K2_9ENTR|nr:YbeF family transcriptional regulator [Cronobacter dublinensis]EGT5660941.1 DNA-binding transcriptional regulator [Cronobacter dublinensis subsp. dublinensis]CCJ79580.1 LysR-family transcriptional regulator YbeF [Cronobacter dublinensis 1210]ALB66046.1 transcriptional regulator [Cronobacter dublinensis subsp. dublinensis LMG 23823]EGT4380659.1 DNA-binding transcriptional regulator [Cronobacter dublinensis]EGT5669986.1 DNA-binding transcriptional regulator [Cronobacter dublinensis subsp. dub
MELNHPPEKPSAKQEDDSRPQIFQTLRNIDLNLLTIFEAVYVHKGIVNAARVLNLTPSAISQSIQKLRLIFPDPLFIRKGQGVTPTAYATHMHEYISQGLESILGALDLQGEHEKQRTITIATSASLGALVIPQIYQQIRKVNPHLQIRNVPLQDTETQLSQFQTDLVVDSGSWSSRTLSTHLLFKDRVAVVCRRGHPCSRTGEPVTSEDLQTWEHTFIMLPGGMVNGVRKQINTLLPDRNVSFSSYNMVTIASIIGSSDLIGFMPARIFALFKDSFGLIEVESDVVIKETIDISLHYNKFSLRDPVVQNVIEAIVDGFASKAVSAHASPS